MASTVNIKTPGVYVEEIRKFPPSVAGVETAIPAFIGFTDFAKKNGEDLTNVPTRIRSFEEFKSFFGGAPPNAATVFLDANDAVELITRENEWYLFDSVHLFYQNGGGVCYVVSVGKYDGGSTNLKTKLEAGLAAIEKKDEPTLLVFPDLGKLDSDAFYSVYQQALLQCATLQDRFVIMDLKKSIETETGKIHDDRVAEFREKIGISNLKYGAAYTPYLLTTLEKPVKFRDITLKRGGADVLLESLTSDNEILQLIYDLENAKKAVDDLKTGKSALLTSPSTSLPELFKSYFDAFYAVTSTALIDFKVPLENIYSLIVDILAAIYDVKTVLPAKKPTVPVPADKKATKDFTFGADIDSIRDHKKIKENFELLLKHCYALENPPGTPPPYGATEILVTKAWDGASSSITAFGKAIVLLGIENGSNISSYTVGTNYSDTSINDFYADPSKTDVDRAKKALRAATSVYTSFINYFESVLQAALTYEEIFDNGLTSAFGFYKNLKTKIQAYLNVTPPCGPVAGVYARVDAERGVWKAPANESLNAIAAPVYLINDADQSDLNVDPNAGKSINAIRSFSGKGTLIWGARTLAGNDNEWRYIPVRRFYIFAEESIKKATEPFVFEPNDANTWVRVRAMIENFLTLQWRAGALAGAKADDAFYVKIGLGETMTAVDILEGRMIVEVGMAVVRPAEFIILRFTHKMQES